MWPLARRSVIPSRSRGRRSSACPHCASLWYPECDLRQWWRGGVGREGHEGSDLERIFSQMVGGRGIHMCAIYSTGGGLGTEMAITDGSYYNFGKLRGWAQNKRTKQRRQRAMRPWVFFLLHSFQTIGYFRNI